MNTNTVFRKNTTNNHTLDITEKNKINIRSKYICISVFNNLQKAFDTVNHDIPTPQTRPLWNQGLTE